MARINYENYQIVLFILLTKYQTGNYTVASVTSNSGMRTTEFYPTDNVLSM